MIQLIEAAPSQVVSKATGRRMDAIAALLEEEFGVPFRFVGTDGRCTSGPPRDHPGPREVRDPVTSGPVREALGRVASGGKAEVVPDRNGRLHLLLPFVRPEGGIAVAVGEMAALANSGPGEAVERDRVGKWLRCVHDRLRLADAEPPVRRHPATGSERPAWEALMGLDLMLRSHRVHRDPSCDVRRLLDDIARLLDVQAVSWVPTGNQGQVISSGTPLLSSWEGGQLAHILTMGTSWKEEGYYLCNDVRGASWGARFADVATLLAVPVAEKTVQGWFIAINKRGQGPAMATSRGGAGAVPLPFRNTDAALLMPFVSLAGLALRAHQRYRSLKELLVGLTRALTSAIDAKDAYTYGHSERVGRIAVVLGRGLGLPEEELSDIYLAGLLHDIGKIGIRDSVLGKRGPLTPEEAEHIKEHVTIGYRILSGLGTIKHLLPGVLYHHERHDGTGYPEGLKGETIPRLARILAVADGYDAMTTCRPYRDALQVGEVERILQQGAGSQWDDRVVQVALRSRAELVAIHQKGVGESLRGALDDAMRYQGPDGDIQSRRL